VKPNSTVPAGFLFGSRVQSEIGFARRELAPAGRLELELETKHITVELDGFIHVGDELNHVPELCSLHLRPYAILHREDWNRMAIYTTDLRVQVARPRLSKPP
jgi:hypothetical protein